MINIKEHRIGNLVMGVWEDYDSGKEVKGLCRITSLCECGSLGEGDWHVMVESLHGGEQREIYDEFEPIPLSEEWLLKMGFEKKAEHNLRKFIFERGIIHAYTNNSEVEIELGNKSGYSFGFPKVKSVHQLQNLFFSLTGEELTIKN